MFRYLYRKYGVTDQQFWCHTTRQLLTAWWYWGDMAGPQPGDPLFGLELG
jgi:hypothetical protein